MERTKHVRLGYEVGTGEPVDIPIGHMVITGQSQLAGKTPDKPGTYREVKKLLELGFLTVDAEDQYQVAPGMKANIHKAKV